MTLGLVIENQRVTWTAFAVLAMFGVKYVRNVYTITQITFKFMTSRNSFVTKTKCETLTQFIHSTAKKNNSTSNVDLQVS